MVDRNSFLQAPLHHLWVMGSSLTCENNSHITLSLSVRFLLLLPVELVQKHRNWTRIQETEWPFSKQSYGNSIRLAGLVEMPASECQPLALSVISALHPRGRHSRAQQQMVIQGWRGAETPPAPWPLSNPPQPSEEQKFPRNIASKTTR